jgi:hypothetical protein
MPAISINELRDGLCACIVPVAPFPTYCGYPVDTSSLSAMKLRFCAEHAEAYLNRRKSNALHRPNYNPRKQP